MARAGWRDPGRNGSKRHATLDVAALTGNHDRALDGAVLDIRRTKRIRWRTGPFLFRHLPHADPHRPARHRRPRASQDPRARRPPAVGPYSWLRESMSRGCLVFSDFTGGQTVGAGDGSAWWRAWKAVPWRSDSCRRRDGGPGCRLPVTWAKEEKKCAKKFAAMTSPSMLLGGKVWLTASSRTARCPRAATASRPRSIPAGISCRCRWRCAGRRRLHAGGVQPWSIALLGGHRRAGRLAGAVPLWPSKGFPTCNRGHGDARRAGVLAACTGRLCRP